MDVRTALTALIEKRDLSRDEMLSIMQQIMKGELTPVQIAGLLIALRCKGETITEIAAAASVMRELSTKVPLASDEHLVDTCGTGGDGAHTFNISTASAIVAAAAGAKVAKHGGRSVSSTCGSADVLEALSVNVNLTPGQVAQSVQEIGVGFMFAPNHHSAMKFAAPVRRELAVRTLFNLLGPMTNPAGARNQVMGVFSRDLVGKLAHVLKELPILKFGHIGIAVQRDFIQAIGGMHDHHMAAAQLLEHVGQLAYQVAAEYPQHLVSRTRRVGHRAQQIE